MRPHRECQRYQHRPGGETECTQCTSHSSTEESQPPKALEWQGGARKKTSHSLLCRAFPTQNRMQTQHVTKRVCLHMAKLPCVPMASKTLYFSTWEGRNRLPSVHSQVPQAGLAFLKHKVDLHARGAQRQGSGRLALFQTHLSPTHVGLHKALCRWGW